MKAQQDKEAAWQADRRTEFRVLSFRYIPKGGLSHADSLRMERLKDAKVSGQGTELHDSTDNGGQDQTPAPSPTPAPTPAPAPNKPHGPMMPQANELFINNSEKK